MICDKSVDRQFPAGFFGRRIIVTDFRQGGLMACATNKLKMCVRTVGKRTAFPGEQRSLGLPEH